MIINRCRSAVNDKSLGCGAYQRVPILMVFKGQKRSVAFLLCLVLVMAGAMLWPHLAQAQEFDRREGRSSVVNTLGWTSIGCGVLGTGTFVAYMQFKKKGLVTVAAMQRGASTKSNTTESILSNGSTSARSLIKIYKPVLNFHIAMNAIGYAAGLVHGYVLSSRLDLIALALVIVMTASVASGIMLRFGTRNLKLFNIQIHGNIGFVILLITLVAMHILTAGGDD